MTTTPNPTAEQIIEDALRNSYASGSALARLIVSDLHAHGLLSGGAPSEEQVARVRRMLKPFGLGDACTDRDLRQALTAAGVAPQVPNQNETKSGNNFVSLDPEKVADVLNDHDYMYSTSACKCLWTGPGSHQAHQSEALCEAYTEGRLT